MNILSIFNTTHFLVITLDEKGPSWIKLPGALNVNVCILFNESYLESKRLEIKALFNGASIGRISIEHLAVWVHEGMEKESRSNYYFIENPDVSHVRKMLIGGFDFSGKYLDVKKVSSRVVFRLITARSVLLSDDLISVFDHDRFDSVVRMTLDTCDDGSIWGTFNCDQIIRGFSLPIFINKARFLNDDLCNGLSLEDNSDLIAGLINIVVEEVSAKFEFDHADDVNNYLLRYIPMLKKMKKRLVYKDEYGDIVIDDWQKELKSVVNNKLQELVKIADVYMMDELGKFGRMADGKIFIEKLIGDIIDRETDDGILTAGSDNVGQMSGVEFETHVMQLLCSFGWDVSTTPTAGDQGGDLIAVKLQSRVVIQCKNWADPVGNAAVQEVFSAKRYYNCNRAIVIAVNGYTKAAYKLANATNVDLLSHFDLNEL